LDDLVFVPSHPSRCPFSGLVPSYPWNLSNLLISFHFFLVNSFIVSQGHGLDRDVAISHLEKYVSVTKSEEQFASEVSALKEKLSSVEQLRASGQTSEADELDKTLDSEISTLRQNIAKHASGSRYQFQHLHFFYWLTNGFFSAEARHKQSSEDIRARVEQTMSRLGKDRPSREDKGDAPSPRDPEELKRLHEDMINKQKDFIAHRKEVLDVLS
jgi:hypothetical protein